MFGDFKNCIPTIHQVWGRPQRIPVSVYLSQFCHDCVQAQFSWLFPPLKADKEPPIKDVDDDGKPIVIQDVASFDITIFEDYQGMNIH
jgi:hypothetical protein